MHNFFEGIGRNFKMLVMRNVQVHLSYLSQPWHLSADTHTPTIPEFILSVSNQNGHSLADEMTGISESQQAMHLVQPARAHLSLKSQNANLLVGFLILCSSLHCSVYHLGLLH